MDILVAMSNSRDFDQNIFKNKNEKKYIFKYTKRGFYEELNNLKSKNNNLKIIIFKKLNDEDEFNLYELKELKSTNKNSQLLIILENSLQKNKDFLLELTACYIDNIIFYKDLKNLNLDEKFKLKHLELLRKLNLQDELLNSTELKEIYRQILTLKSQNDLNDYIKDLLSKYDSKTLEYIIKNAPKKIEKTLKNNKNMLFLYPKENIFTLMAGKLINYKNQTKNKNEKFITLVDNQRIYLVFSNNSCGSTEIASNFSNGLAEIHKNKKIALVDLDFFEFSCAYNFLNNNKNYKPFINIDFSNKDIFNTNFMDSKSIHYFKSKNLCFYTNILENEDQKNLIKDLSKEKILDNMKIFINILLFNFDYIIIDFNLNIDSKLMEYLFSLNTTKLLVVDENLKNLFSLRKYLIRNKNIFKYCKLNLIINKSKEYLKLKDLKNFLIKESLINISVFIKIPYECKIHKYKLENKTVYDFSNDDFKKSIKNIYHKSV
ncbi:hypothetical protein WG909_13960 [Peptostreptococcaceae bacterium AGR-M142]